jgi:hypothetical protein
MFRSSNKWIKFLKRPCDLLVSFCLPIYLSINLSICLSTGIHACPPACLYIYICVYQFSSGPSVTGFRSPQLPVYASSHVKFLCFITHSTSFFPLYFWSSTSLSSSRWPGHHSLRPSVTAMPNTCPYHFNILFSVLSKTDYLTPIFSLVTSFLTLIIWWSLQLLSLNPFLYLTVFL